MAEKTETDVQAQLTALADNIAQLTGLVRDLTQGKTSATGEDLAGKLGEFAAASHDLGDKAREAMRDEVAAIERQIVEKPLQSALIAFVAGLVLGAILRR